MTEDKVDENGPYFVTTETDSEIGAKWFLVNGPGIKTIYHGDSGQVRGHGFCETQKQRLFRGEKAEREKLHRIIMGDTNESRP